MAIIPAVAEEEEEVAEAAVEEEVDEDVVVLHLLVGSFILPLVAGLETIAGFLMSS